MYDSITADDIPPTSVLVAGYIDGTFKWTDADWALFPDRVKVRIAVRAATDDGHVLDIETGAASPDQAPAWVRMRRAAGVDPTCYVNLSNWQATRDAFAAAGEPFPHWWVALYDNDPSPFAGAVAKQYANSRLTGGHYDASVVADFWPGVDSVDQFVTKQEFEAYKVALQKQLDENYATSQHQHTVVIPGGEIATSAPKP